jgi:hypothetical protein
MHNDYTDTLATKPHDLPETVVLHGERYSFWDWTGRWLIERPHSWAQLNEWQVRDMLRTGAARKA